MIDKLKNNPTCTYSYEYDLSVQMIFLNKIKIYIPMDKIEEISKGDLSKIEFLKWHQRYNPRDGYSWGGWIPYYSANDLAPSIMGMMDATEVSEEEVDGLMDLILMFSNWRL